MRRREGPSRIRGELAAEAEQLLGIALTIGSARVARQCRKRLKDLSAGRSISGLYGWQCRTDPSSGPWTLTSDNRLVLEERARA